MSSTNCSSYCVLALVIVGVCSSAVAQLNRLQYETVDITAPIPLFSPPPGWALGCPPDFGPLPQPVAARVVVEVMLDLVCPDSADAWHVMKQLREMYHTHELSIVIHIYQLPYHRNAYILSQGFHLIRERYPNHMVEYIDIVFEHYPELKADATENMSDVEVLSYVSALVASIGVPAAEFRADVAGYRTMTTHRWKYAARRGVAGTPWYFVNGIDLAADPNQTLDLQSWRHFIDSMLTDQ